MGVGKPLQVPLEGITVSKINLRGDQKQCWARKIPFLGARVADTVLDSPPLPSPPVPSPVPELSSVSSVQSEKARGARSESKTICRGCCSSYTCADCSTIWLARREPKRELPRLSGSSLFPGCSLPGRSLLPSVSHKACLRHRSFPFHQSAASSRTSTPSFCVSPSFSFPTSFFSNLVTSRNKKDWRSPLTPRQSKQTSGAGTAALLPRVDLGPRPPPRPPPQQSPKSHLIPPPLPPPLPPSSRPRPSRVPGPLVTVTVHFPEDYCNKIHVHVK